MRQAENEKFMHRAEPMRNGPKPCCVYSAELLGGDPELLILHRGGLYRLRNGRKGRLELLGPEPSEGAAERKEGSNSRFVASRSLHSSPPGQGTP